ncbi:stalk domain-containing protein [Paenibacillus sp. GD4]|uniref:stalk domain-containing protein n=1 Tax=Paenibacillus sp. GD4 TaxID=3068890 RepID=UPI002796B3B9|nr:stalk domain-containing protein [Paenibacillus sp. GD4]MDQ1911164.1 stalk domain-containing protein [Paenibacillus sp. GD4]
MKKGILTMLLLLGITNIASASTLNGEFEGNPIVKVEAGEQELKVEDVPAINYKGRTMVPIYLLRQLGAEVTWNDASYSVSVALDQTKSAGANSGASSPAQGQGQPQPVLTQEQKELELIKQVYQTLHELDQEIWSFTERLGAFKELDNAADFSFQLDADLQSLSQQYMDFMALALKVSEKVKTKNKIFEIIQSQSKVMEQLNKTKGIIQFWIKAKNDTNLNSTMNTAMYNTLQEAQRNLAHTNKVIRELALKDIQKQLP